MITNPHEVELRATTRGEEPGRGRLEGRKILIIGGGQRVFDAATDPVGNGRAMSIISAREGATVAVADREASAADATVDLITSEGHSAFSVIGDVVDPEQAEAIVRTAHEKLGGLDGVVYNVGIGIEAKHDLAGVDLTEWNRTFAVNVTGAMLCGRAALSVMSSGGSIVYTSSTASLHARTRLVAYDTTKVAMLGVMRNVAREGSEHAIRANIICPGLVDTPLGRAAGAGRPDRANSVIPIGREATAWDIAYATLFFLSDDSTYVTGQTLAVDGGRTGI